MYMFVVKQEMPWNLSLVVKPGLEPRMFAKITVLESIFPDLCYQIFQQRDGLHALH